MVKPRAICVYCGSSPGQDPEMMEVARRLGAILAANHIEMIYGGGSLGLMGASAKAALDGGGRVTGIIPQFLKDIEVQFEEVSELIVTQGMHERKQLMFERADAFVSLPGGIGTLEETVEMLTWAQLGQHKKPVVLVNINAYWSPLLQLFQHMVEQDFVKPDVGALWASVDQVEDVLPTVTARLADTSFPSPTRRDPRL